MAKPEILIVDDDPRVNARLARQLQERGFETITLKSAFGLLATLSRGQLPDLVLLDIHLPGLSGDSVLQKIRSTPEFSHIKTPVIFISGLSPERLEAIGQRCGADAWLSKPVDIDLLNHTIKELLAGSETLVDESCALQSQSA